MFTTKFDDNELTVLIDETVQKELTAKAISPIEVCRLIESFAAKILANKAETLIKMTNEETGASLDLEVNWESEHKVSVKVVVVNLENLKATDQPRSKVNLAETIQPDADAETKAN